MRKKIIFYLLISSVFCGVLLITCKTPQKNITEKKDTDTPITTIENFDTIKVVSYLPPPADSISEISINLVGDLMCHLPQTNNARLSNGEYDFNPTFTYIKPYLENADITIGNLETTFAGTSQPYAGYPAFNSPDAYCTALKNTGFDFLVTANNHSMDTRESGLMRTIEVIKQHQLGYAGTFLNQKDHDSIRIIEKKGIKLGLLNYTYGTNGAYPSNEHHYMLNKIDSVEIFKDVKQAKNKGADIVLVFFHMGVENVIEPTKEQKKAVQLAMDAGAKLVIGAHPHMVGPTQITYSSQNKDSVFTAYSLGNFLSNQYWRYTDAGVILKLIVQKNHTKQITKFKNASFMPTWVYRGDGTKKMHIILPAQWAYDSIKLPSFISENHRKKMQEAFEDTKMIFTKNNAHILLHSSK